MRRLVQWIWPKENDGLALTGFVLILVSVAMPSVVRWEESHRMNVMDPLDHGVISRVVVAGLLLLIVGISAIAGGFRQYGKRRAAVGVVLMLTAMGAFVSSAMISDCWNTQTESEILTKWFNGSGVVRLLAFGVGSGLVVLILQRVATRLLGRETASVENSKTILISATALMILVAFGRNLSLYIGQSGGKYADPGSGTWTFYLYAVLLLAVLVLLSRIVALWVRLVVLFAWAFVLLIGGFVESLGGEALARSPVYATLILCGLLGLAAVLVSPRIDEEELPSSTDGFFGWIGISPVVTMSFVIVLLTEFVFNLRYDVVSMLRGSNLSIARVSRMVTLDPHTQMDLSIDSEDNFEYFRFKFSEDSRRDILSAFSTKPFSLSLEMDGLTTEVDCKAIGNLLTPASSTLTSGTITSKQLSQILSGSTFVEFNGVTVVDSSTPTRQPTQQSWNVIAHDPGALASLLSCVEDFSLLGKVTIRNGELSESDWGQVMRALQGTKVEISDCSLPANALSNMPDNDETAKALANLTTKTLIDQEPDDYQEIFALAELVNRGCSVDFQVDQHSRERKNRNISPEKERWSFHHLEPGQLNAFLSLIGRFTGRERIIIRYSRLSGDDWRQLIRATDSDVDCYLDACHLDADLLDRVFGEKPLVPKMLFGAFVDEDGNPDMRTTLRFLLESNAEGSANLRQHFELSSAENMDFNWTFKTTGHGNAGDGRIETLGVSDSIETVREFLATCHWLYPSEDGGESDCLYYPFHHSRSHPFEKIAEILSGLGELRQLSLDNEWFHPNRTGIYHPEREADCAVLRHLAGLEELYLPRSVRPFDVNFLEPLVNLEKLTINAKMKDSTGFAKCKSLEELTLFYTPHRRALVDILQIKTLKKLTIVDLVNSQPASLQKFAGMIRKKRPDLKVTVVGDDEFRPMPTKEFKRHREAIKRRFREKLTEIADSIEETVPE